jgi:hypothetical protein
MAFRQTFDSRRDAQVQLQYYHLYNVNLLKNKYIFFDV